MSMRKKGKQMNNNQNNQNIDIEEKRKIFLEELDKIEPNILKLERFEQFSGPGIKRKIQRLIDLPNIYIPYIFWRISGKFLKDKKINLFWDKDFLVNGKDLECIFIIIFKTAGCIAELKLTKFFIKNLKKNDIFYDIGANYGFYSCLAAEFCKEVHSFEPVPEIFNYLKKNTEEYPNIFLNNLAISDKNGIVDIYLDKKTSGSSTINKNVLDKNGFTLGNKEKIQTITLDEYVKNHSYPTVIKMDIEGSEKMAIEGGENFLKNESPIIAMEVWSKEAKGEISMEAVEKLRNLGYKSYFINLDGSLKEIQGELTGDNYIFKKQF